LHSGLADTQAIAKLFIRMLNDGHKDFDVIELF